MVNKVPRPGMALQKRSGSATRQYLCSINSFNTFFQLAVHTGLGIAPVVTKIENKSESCLADKSTWGEGGMGFVTHTLSTA